MDKLHLKIQKGQFQDMISTKPYKVTTYYDYVLDFYFDTRKEAQAFIDHSKFMDRNFRETA
tara:strand:- start:1897 stop:2079 length:183 start_codon:yes stop_codon:yes gene_type:complete